MSATSLLQVRAIATGELTGVPLDQGRVPQFNWFV
jgi:hypothetical protein